MRTQAERGADFRALHQGPGAFLLPNPWDVGTARMLAQLGFAALATTSAGFALSLGQRDNSVGRDRMMAHVAAIAGATELPVSGDLENGFGDDPEMVAEAIRLAAKAGLVGASIEDSTSDPDNPIHAHDLAVERIRAAADAAHALAFPFTLTARAENHLVGRADLADTIKRLQAYQAAGADVLFAPGLTEARDIASVVGSVDRPVNVLVGLKGRSMSLEALSQLGVKRVSVGSALCRAALGAFLGAAREMRDQGTFEFATDTVSLDVATAMFDPWSSQVRS
ncbi:MAG: isocitrate lyase/phosphoenolpyruvate mutase family protein [Candidatus Eisenbacteria bacterium]